MAKPLCYRMARQRKNVADREALAGLQLWRVRSFQLPGVRRHTGGCGRAEEIAKLLAWLREGDIIHGRPFGRPVTYSANVVKMNEMQHQLTA